MKNIAMFMFWLAVFMVCTTIVLSIATGYWIGWNFEELIELIENA